jgi:hypothetical protein
LVVDGLQVMDECAVRLARESDRPGKLLEDAVAIGARVLDREQTGADLELMRAELEKTSREVSADLERNAGAVIEQIAGQVSQAFGPETGHVTKVLERHFSDGSAGAVQHRVKAAIEEVMTKSRQDMVRQFSSADASNPLAQFQKTVVEQMHAANAQQHAHLRQMHQTVAGLSEEIVKLQAEKQRLQDVEAEREKGTAKGRSFEESVVEALDRIAHAQGDDCHGVGDHKEATRKTGDVVVSIGACQGPTLGRIVFEAKDKKLSRPRAFEELDGAMAERNADYAVLVVPTEDEVPAKMLPLREYNGDKLIVPFDAEDPQPLSLQVAYSLARARVLMARSEGDGIDGDAVRETAERALGALEDVRRIKQQLTGAKTQIDKAAEIVDAMSARVKAHLQEIDALVLAEAPVAEAVAVSSSYAA